jgi:predicted RNase H-like HicB family nuclease
VVTFRALIEQWGRETLVFFDGWPGCFVSAATLEEAMAAAPAAVTDHLAWLTVHGLGPFDTVARVEIAEHLRPQPGARGLRFDADQMPPSDEDLERALKIGALACAELIDHFERAGPQRRDQAVAPGAHEIAKSPADQLRHLAELDLVYAATLSDRRPAAVELPSDPTEALRTSHRHVAARLRALPASLRSRRFVHDGEEWTAAKVVRRRTGHLFEHYPPFRSLAGA